MFLYIAFVFLFCLFLNVAFEKKIYDYLSSSHSEIPFFKVIKLICFPIIFFIFVLDLFSYSFFDEDFYKLK